MLFVFHMCAFPLCLSSSAALYLLGQEIQKINWNVWVMKWTTAIFQQMALPGDMKIGVFSGEGSRWEIDWWSKKQKQWERLKVDTECQDAEITSALIYLGGLVHPNTVTCRHQYPRINQERQLLALKVTLLLAITKNNSVNCINFHQKHEVRPNNWRAHFNLLVVLGN